MNEKQLQKHVEQQVHNIMCVDIDCSCYISNAVGRTLKSIISYRMKCGKLIKMDSMPRKFII